MDLQTHKTLSEDRQQEIMAKLAEWRALAEASCQSVLETMQQCEDFNNGDQWDAALKADMESHGKYVATIPLIRPQVNQLLGHMVSNPKDITIVDSHGGLKTLSDLHTALLKHAMDTNDGQSKLAKWFHRGAISQRGYLAWFRDYTRDQVNGDLVIHVLPEFDCLWDATCTSYDPNGTGSGANGAKYFFWDEPVDQEWAEKRWPGIAEKFGAAPAPTSGGGIFSGFVNWLYGRRSAREGNTASLRSTQQLPDYESTRYILQHCWWMEYVDAWYWYDTRAPQMDAVVVWQKGDIKAAKAATEANPDTYRMIRSVVRVCHHTLSIGDQFCEDIVDEFDLAKANLTAFPVVPFYPAHSWGRCSGVVEDMIGPQETLNWLRSQVVNILKLGPNAGWIIGQDIQNYSQYLAEHSGEPAQVIDRSKCGGYAERLRPPEFPAGLDLISEKSKGEIREASNMRLENPVQDKQDQSGRAILAKQASAQTGISPQLANFDYSLAIFGRIGVDIIRCSTVYSDEEIQAIIEQSRLVDDQLLYEAQQMVCMTLGIEYPQAPPMPNPELYAQQSLQVRTAVMQMYTEEQQAYQMAIGQVDKIARPIAIQALIDAARNPVAGRYHATVALSPYSLTTKIQMMASAAETHQLLIASGYQGLPERDIIEMSDLPNKQRLLKERGYA